MQLLGILIELRGEGAANAGIYRHTCRSRASSIFVLHAPYKVTGLTRWVATQMRRPTVRNEDRSLRNSALPFLSSVCGLCMRGFGKDANATIGHSH